MVGAIGLRPAAPGGVRRGVVTRIRQFASAIVRRFRASASDGPLSERPFYKSFPTPLDIAMVDKLCAVNHRHRYAYFRIFKAANSTIVSHLYEMETGVAHQSLDSIQPVKDTYFDRLGNLSSGQVEDVLSGYLKFAVVRDPYTRALAAYLDKVSRNIDAKGDHVRARLGMDKDDDLSFDIFVRYLEEGGIDENAHWARQSELIALPVAKLDVVARFEALPHSVDGVFRSLFGSVQRTADIREHATGALRDNPLLSATIKQRLYRLYEPDFETFAYAQ